MAKTLIIFRLYNPTYGPQGNAKTLLVYLREDNTIGYSFYGGWEDSGISFAIENLQLKYSLPTNPKPFGSTRALFVWITGILKTGVGENHISSYEILNELSKPKAKTNVQASDVWVGMIPDIFGYGIQVFESSEAAVRKSLKKHFLEAKKNWKSDITFSTAMVLFGGKYMKIEFGKAYYDNIGY